MFRTELCDQPLVCLTGFLLVPIFSIKATDLQQSQRRQLGSFPVLLDNLQQECLLLLSLGAPDGERDDLLGRLARPRMHFAVIPENAQKAGQHLPFLSEFLVDHRLRVKGARAKPSLGRIPFWNLAEPRQSLFVRAQP